MRNTYIIKTEHVIDGRVSVSIVSESPYNSKNDCIIAIRKKTSDLIDIIMTVIGVLDNYSVQISDDLNTNCKAIVKWRCENNPYHEMIYTICEA